MLILLPAETDGLAEVEKDLTLKQLNALDFQKREIMVALPRFKLESFFQLAEPLRVMGMPLPFSSRADFSGMTSAGAISLTEVVHKAFVELNETGTEAAAATAALMQKTALPAFFRADHPFLFLIRENQTGTILFIGRFCRPQQDGNDSASKNQQADKPPSANAGNGSKTR